MKNDSPNDKQYHGKTIKKIHGVSDHQRTFSSKGQNGLAKNRGRGGNDGVGKNFDPSEHDRTPHALNARGEEVPHEAIDGLASRLLTDIPEFKRSLWSRARSSKWFSNTAILAGVGGAAALGIGIYLTLRGKGDTEE